MQTTDALFHGTVLLVDDDVDDRRILQAAFTREAPSIDFRAVPSSDAALAELKAMDEAGMERNILVISDLKMAGGTGIELLAKLRSDPAVCMVPFVIMSNSRSEADVRAAYTAGCNGYFIKPLSLTATREFVARLAGYWLSPNASVPVRVHAAARAS